MCVYIYIFFVLKKKRQRQLKRWWWTLRTVSLWHLPSYQTCMSLAPETNHLRLTVLQTSFHPKKAHAAKGHAFKHKTFQTWRNGFTIGKHFKRLLPTTSIPSHRRTVRRATPTWRSETLESLLSVVASIHRYSHGGWHPRAVFIRSNTSFRHAGRFPWVGLVEWLVFGGLLKILKKNLPIWWS